jgi:hypothetical protein
MTLSLLHQAPIDISVDWGDGGQLSHLHLTEDDPGLARFLRNAVDPRRHAEIAQILGIDVFERVYSKGQFQAGPSLAGVYLGV